MLNESSDSAQLRKDAENDTDPRVDLAVERTELALERTQLAWIRTTLSFLGSGIALDKGIEVMHQARLVSGTAFIQHAHVVGISLSIAGTLLLSYVTRLFINRSRSLAIMKGSKPPLVPPGAWASLLIILLGAVVSFLLLVT